MRSILDACGFSAGSRICVRRRKTQAMALSSVALVPEAPVWAESHEPSKVLIIQAVKLLDIVQVLDECSPSFSG